MVDQSVVISVRNYLQKLNENGLNVIFGVVFGSQVKGNTNEWSDIDLLVVSSLFDGQLTRQNASLLWRIAARTESRIEPIPCGLRQWEEDDSSAIVEIARREGEKIALFDEKKK